MFTGIIECTGVVQSTRVVAGGVRLGIGKVSWARECKLGDSASVSGVCLTVAAQGDASLEFDVIRETLDKSTLGNKGVGDGVNLERSLRVGDRLDGHFVQGHVDGTARVADVRSSAEEWLVWFEPQPHMAPYMIPKGSVAIEGVSLTIAAVRDASFSVALIPTTLTRTTLGALHVGDTVNVESDIIARTIVHRLDATASAFGLTLETLQRTGFA